MKRRSGSALVESAVTIPLAVLLLVGMNQLAKFTYTYYTLRKTVYSIGEFLSGQQGVNFCSTADPTVSAAITFGLTGTTDPTAPALVTGLDPSMIQITAERATYGGPGAPFTLSDCSCAPDCDISQGAIPPDFIVVTVAGYMLTPRIPMVPMVPIALTPTVKVPYGGT